MAGYAKTWINNVKSIVLETKIYTDLKYSMTYQKVKRQYSYQFVAIGRQICREHDTNEKKWEFLNFLFSIVSSGHEQSAPRGG